MENIYRPIKAKVENIVQETANIKTFVLRPEEPMSFAAGQFMQLTVPGKGEAPFTPSSSMYESEKLEFTIMKAGSITSILHEEIKEGDWVGLRGPLGKGYATEKWEGKEIFVVGGGVGAAPLRALLLALFHQIEKYKKIYVRLGFRSPADISYKEQLKTWQKKEGVDFDLTVDVGDKSWKGKVGIVTTLLDQSGVAPKNAVAIVCGPPIMMKFVTLKLIDLGFADHTIYLSMEKNMSCGVGKCFHCNLGPYLACKDGPVFTWDKVKGIPEPF